MRGKSERHKNRRKEKREEGKTKEDGARVRTRVQPPPRRRRRERKEGRGERGGCGQERRAGMKSEEKNRPFCRSIARHGTTTRLCPSPISLSLSPRLFAFVSPSVEPPSSDPSFSSTASSCVQCVTRTHESRNRNSRFLATAFFLRCNNLAQVV